MQASRGPGLQPLVSSMGKILERHLTRCSIGSLWEESLHGFAPSNAPRFFALEMGSTNIQYLPFPSHVQQAAESLSPSQAAYELYQTIPWCEDGVKVTRKVVVSSF